ncbi:hypothetical protein [Nonomuraea typhae]|uniref:hypothetical protein n=1 Tax=Nonomuraea typhae TaxID=2603600 RepID=UPI0012FB0762|nr:hypothetical protein [Nonomuraea typhae]
MSKERARRRALREAERAEAMRRNEERQARAARRRVLLSRIAPRPVRFARQGGVLARRHRIQNVIVLGVFLVVQLVVWLIWRTPAISFGVLVFSVLFVPVVVTLAFNRRI